MNSLTHPYGLTHRRTSLCSMTTSPELTGSDPLLACWICSDPSECDGQRGPDLLRPRPNLRIIPGRVSGEPHLAGSRITTQVAAALYRNITDVEKIAALYPGFGARIFEEAIEFEYSLAA